MRVIRAALRLLSPLSKKGKVIHISAAILSLIQPASLNASGYYRSSCHSYPVKEKVVVKEVEKVVYALQTIPLYSLAYQPVAYTSSYSTVLQHGQKVEYYAQPYALPVAVPYQQPVQYAPLVQKQSHATSCEDKVSALLARIEKLEAGIPERMPLTGNGNGHWTIMKTKCAACHSENPKGNEFVMFKGGEPVTLETWQVGKIGTQLALGKMPKNGTKMSDAEFRSVMEWVDKEVSVPRENLKAPPPTPERPDPVEKETPPK